MTESRASVEAAANLAKHLAMAKDSLYRWPSLSFEHRGLPAHKDGRLWKFELTEIDRWVRSAGADEKGPLGRR